MTWGQNRKEARKNRRVRTDGKVFAAFFSPSQEFVKLGQIIDISEGGVGLRYVGINEQTGESSQLEIFDSNEELQLGRIPCRVVYDMELTGESRGVLKVRRCGVQFQKLSEKQTTALRTFIESNKADNGTGPAPEQADPESP
jgi:c-di-GMP-binding flagellar brake protein YcgR